MKKAPSPKIVGGFAAKVYEATRLVPRGKVATYGAIAKYIRCGSVRAVGTALARNPYAPAVPCHRIVSSKGHLTGFKGSRECSSLDEKAKILEAEGIDLSPRRTSVVNEKQILREVSA